ncbi:MAG: 3-deoxy-manno-octulosonate cytidylyltransferase [Prevotella sp.]|nr:3-deoxy-manno-octulosonate cytidylyltransferase [Prevotella sp.]MCM1075086.1 3-deoxy-manno-octulosonate cytidylyltransferase [Ruminococcus sp.]
MKFAVVIPARWASSRFPGKPLAKLAGVEVINRVVGRVTEAGLYGLVATDDMRILECVQAAGGNAVMTRADHVCGTDRVREAADSLPDDVDVIINVQGDEPFIHPNQLKALQNLFKEYPDTDIATLVRPLPGDTPYAQLTDPAVVKAVVADDGKALYFSRFPVPYQRGVEPELWASRHTYYAHVGVYAYRLDVLKRITQLQPSELEKAESLEQLRWLQAGLTIRTAQTRLNGVGIDTLADLKRAESLLKEGKIKD